MSHFTVLVVGDDVAKQLAPFEERTGIPEERQKWDWWSMGGRWMGYFKLKAGKRGKMGEPGAFNNPSKKGWCDQARKKDIDFEAMIIAARKEGEATISTFAVVKDGRWYERGEMGWWAVVRNEKERKDWEEEFRKLLMSVDDNTLLTLVDCHI